MINDTAIVFIVFDGYEDLWDDAIRLIELYWPLHPPIYVFTNTITHNWPGIKCIPVGDKAEWSMKAQAAVDTVVEQYLILMLEDFYVGAAVDNRKIEELIGFMKSRNIEYCRLCDNNRIVPKLLPKYESGYPYEVIFEDQKYGINLQASVWKKSFLKQIVGKENYNAWVFEVNQTKKARTAEHVPFKRCISSPGNILHIKHGALQGKMLPPTVKYFAEIGHPLSTKRQVMDKYSYTRFIIKHLGKDLTPAFAVKWVKNLARKFGYTFLDEKWS